MKRVLLTGMSGTGKSSLVSELARLGYKAVDVDAEGWSQWVEADGNPTGAKEGKDWVWREERVQHLLATGGTQVLFLSGCAENMVKFFPQFDHIVLLSAPVPVILERLATRTDNPYGKRPEEAAQVLDNLQTVEPLLRRAANHEIDTNAPLSEVVGKILQLVFCILLVLLAVPAHAQERLPVIDMHLHALPADHQGPPPVAMCTPIDPFPAWDPAEPYGARFMAMLKQPPCEDPVWSPMTDEALMIQTLEVVERRNVFGVLSGTPDHVATWMAAAPGRFFPGLGFQLGDDSPSPDSLRALHAAGRLAVLAEVTNQYAGIEPADERMEPYWALAEELDMPVGIHIGPGPPGVIYLGASGYRARLHSALTLEEVFVQHPGIRVYIMHAGFPLLDDLLALLYAHPQVHVDVGVIVFTQPRAVFYRYLQGIVEAGFGNRVMFGSDQMVWPGVIERSIAVIEEAPFLSDEQKRDILYHNAARFLRLSEEEIARHHGASAE